MFKSILALLLAAGLGGNLRAEQTPNFLLKRLDGSTFRLADHLGKQVIVVDFWATWCGPCTKLLKKLQELQTRYPDVLVLAVSIDDGQSMAQVGPYVQGRGYTFTVLQDPSASVLKLFNPKGSVPTTLIIDKKGAIAFSHTGYLAGDEQVLFDKVGELRK